MAKNLFVGSLPYTVTDDSLGQLFTQVGQVQSVNVIKDKYSGQSRGFAFIEMVSDEDAVKAIEKFNGFNLEGRNIVVKEALPKPTYTNGRAGTGRPGGRGGFQRGGFGNRGGGGAGRDFRR